MNPVGELLVRWYSLRKGRPEYFGNAEEEIWILPTLIQDKAFDGTDMLFHALKHNQPDYIFRILLDAGCGRRDGTPARTWKQRAYGSEIIEAIKCNNPVFESMLRYGLAIECEDQMGFSALLHALNHGPGKTDYVQLLIEAGADLTRKTGSGLTPLDLARRNVEQHHPRIPRQSWTVNKEPVEHGTVSLQEDRVAYQMLKAAIMSQLPRNNNSLTWGERIHHWMLVSLDAFDNEVHVQTSSRRTMVSVIAETKRRHIQQALIGLAALVLMTGLLAFNCILLRLWRLPRAHLLAVVSIALLTFLSINITVLVKMMAVLTAA